MESASSATLGNKGKQLHINTNYSPLFNSTTISQQQHSPVSLIHPPISTEHPQQSFSSSSSPLENTMMQPLSFLSSPASYSSNTGHQHHQSHALGNPPIPPYPKPGNSFIIDNKLFSPSIPTPNVPSPSSSGSSQPQPQSSNFHKQLHQHLENKLSLFWRNQIKDISKMDDFKTTHELPLARIKKIMKSDEEVNKISAEVPMLFSKACELFILEITLRSWVHTEMNKRRTLQRIDIANALSRSDVFDFLIDIVPREEIRPNRKFFEEFNKGNYLTPEYLQYIHLQQLAEAQQGGIKRSYSMEITPSGSEQISPSSSPKKRSLSHDFSTGELNLHTQFYNENHNHSHNQHGLHHIMDHPTNLLPASPSYNIPSLLNYSNQNIYQQSGGNSSNLNGSTSNGNNNLNNEIINYNQPNHHHFSNANHEVTSNVQNQFHQYFFHDDHGK